MRQLLAAVFMLVAGQVFGYPEMKGYVNDFVGKTSSVERKQIAEQLGFFHETKGGPQIAVAIVNSLSGQSPEEYARGMMTAWGVGSQDTNDGILILLAPNERQIRIQVGAGSLRWLPRDQVQEIYSNILKPKLRANEYGDGIMTAVNSMIALYETPIPETSSGVVPPVEVSSGSRPVPAEPSSDSGHIWIWATLIAAFFIVIGLLSSGVVSFLSDDEVEDKNLSPAERAKLKIQKAAQSKAHHEAVKVRESIHKTLGKMDKEDRKKALRIMRHWKHSDRSERNWVATRVPHVTQYVSHSSDDNFETYFMWYLIGQNSNATYAPDYVSTASYGGGSSGGAGASSSWSSSDDSSSSSGSSGDSGGFSGGDGGSSFSSGGGGGDF